VDHVAVTSEGVGEWRKGNIWQILQAGECTREKVIGRKTREGQSGHVGV